ncbi:hypothetical protein KP509_32G023200 [Ceratopteris richardii]|uniref:Bifunctional lysine-specific demethylase and histidyl-hydroxylase n=1 Tax=Ceratopteris richardii TaxID=49495 RepID=A0A8T2QT76_CERRI|nr:hypothetical protein KP509_32G023200 [Ceratopteris richardii]
MRKKNKRKLQLTSESILGVGDSHRHRGGKEIHGCHGSGDRHLSIERAKKASKSGCITDPWGSNRRRTLVVAMVHLFLFVGKGERVDYGRQELVIEALESIRRACLSSRLQQDETIFQGLLAVMPALLRSNGDSVLVRSISLVEDIVLDSYQFLMNLIRETSVLHKLLVHLGSADEDIQKQVCHLISTIASCVHGKEILCRLGATQKLMYLLFMVTEPIMDSINGKDVLRLSSNLLSNGQKFLCSSVLCSLSKLTLNNVSECLGTVWQGCQVSALKPLQNVWTFFRNTSLYPVDDDEIRAVAKMIVSLTMELESLDDEFNDSHMKIIDDLFGKEGEFTHFWDEHWEQYPSLISEGVLGGELRLDLFKSWQIDGDPFFLRKLLTRSTTCPPFSCDKVETSHIFKEIEEDIGRPIIFGQDIRLVKSVCSAGCSQLCSIHSVHEEDYHKVIRAENMNNAEKVMYADVETCVHAYEMGYTIALRGLEFRCPHVAAIAEALAICFGQATVGANLYMTPSNAQGFKPHHDDHCVLVWQIKGSKVWKLWTPKVPLPRLYSQHSGIERGCTDEEDFCKVSLKEGNILYIPRGFPHAASTQTRSQTPHVCSEQIKSTQRFTNCSRGSESCMISRGYTDKIHDSTPTFHSDSRCVNMPNFFQQVLEDNIGQSLHITFGVEVEPPFEWEGLIHMALQCWAAEDKDIVLGRKVLKAEGCETSGTKSKYLYLGLLHVAVRQCGDDCSTFRKACLIAAKPPFGFYGINEFGSTFMALIDNVANKASFRKALNIVLTAIDTPDSNSLDWMHWMHNISGAQDSTIWSDPVTFFHSTLMDDEIRYKRLEDMEIEFSQMKDSFILCANYAQASDVFISLLQKYRSVRQKYMKGMLYLHN